MIVDDGSGIDEHGERDVSFEHGDDKDDLFLSARLTKRMRLEEALQDGESADHYGAVNDLLSSLHSQRNRRLQNSAPNAVNQQTAANPQAVSSTSEPQCGVDVEEWSVQTRFALSDVVSCSHSPTGRCLQCSGRSVQNLPVGVYSAYCKAFKGVKHIAHPDPSEAAGYSVPARSLVAGEISFASFAALIADAGPMRPCERFLDLGSGSGRAVVAFALMLPDSMTTGIEIRPSLHEMGVGVMARLSPDMHQRISLLCGDMFQVSWAEATVLFVNSTGFDETLMARVLEKLQDTASGAKVITLSQPLPRSSGNAVGVGPPGFELLRQAKYRMTWGNATAYHYQRVR